MYSNYAGYIILIPADIFKNTSKGIFHVYRCGLAALPAPDPKPSSAPPHNKATIWPRPSGSTFGCIAVPIGMPNLDILKIPPLQIYLRHLGHTVPRIAPR